MISEGGYDFFCSFSKAAQVESSTVMVPDTVCLLFVLECENSIAWSDAYA